MSDQCDRERREQKTYLIASRSPPGQDCRRQARKEQIVEKMKYSRRALWKRTATNMPEESEHSYSERNQGYREASMKRGRDK